MHQTEQNLSDLELIKLIQNGDTELYEVIVRRYNHYLYKVGRSYGYLHDDVEDLMQDTFINAFTHLSGFENRSSFKTWLVQIMIHQCFQKRHKLSYQNELPSSESIPENATTFFGKKNYDGNRVVDNIELREIIEEAILHVPEDQRIVFSLRELTGMTTQETAEVLKITEGNVKVRLNRAREALREYISHSYSSRELFDFHLSHCNKMVERVMKAHKG